MDKTSGLIEVEGATLAYIIEGTQELRKHLQMIFVDMRPFAPEVTAEDISRFTLDSILNDIEQVRKALGLAKVAIAGHSIHGLMAFEYAYKYTENTSHLIMISTPPFNSTKMISEMLVFWESDASEERKTTFAHKTEKMIEAGINVEGPATGDEFIKVYVGRSPIYWFDPAYDSSWIWDRVQVNIDYTYQVLGNIFNGYDISYKPSLLTVPTFIASGRYDYAVPYVTWNDRKGLFPNLSYHLFEKSGHTPQLEVPDDFNRKLIDWITAV